MGKKTPGTGFLEVGQRDIFVWCKKAFDSWQLGKEVFQIYANEKRCKRVFDNRQFNITGDLNSNKIVFNVYFCKAIFSLFEGGNQEVHIIDAFYSTFFGHFEITMMCFQLISKAI